MEERADDWQLVRYVIDTETAFHGKTQTDLCDAAGIDRTVLQSMSKGRPVSDAVLRRIEGALGLPREFLLYVAKLDFPAMEETNASRDLIRLIRRRSGGDVERTNGDAS